MKELLFDIGVLSLLACLAVGFGALLNWLGERT